jgi:uncharacterized protein
MAAGLATPSHPFCSPRCRLVDLGNWLGNRYAIAGDSEKDPSEMSDEELAALFREPS